MNEKAEKIAAALRTWERLTIEAEEEGVMKLQEETPPAPSAYNGGMNEDVCAGAGEGRSYAPGDVTATNGAGKPSYARVTCRTCSRGFTARIVRSQQGVSLGRNGVVIVPRHKPAST